MDFTFNEEQLAVSEAAGGLFAGLVTPERVQEVEATEDRFDRELWARLAQADVLGLSLPEAFGGGGYGMVELALVLEAQGRSVAPIPLWETIALGALPIAELGSVALQGAVLRGVTSGDIVLTAALTDVAGDIALGGDGQPSVSAVAGPDGLVLHGTAFAVPAAHLADLVLVPVAVDDGVVVAVIDPRQDGVTVERAVTTNRQIHPHLHFDGVAVADDRLLAGGDPTRGHEVVTWMLNRAHTGLCAIQVGVTEAAVSQTAAYLNDREQFGRPLSTFQGTMLRAADAAIDIEAMRVTLWNATWLFDTGRDATDAARVAKWQASERGQRTVHSTQHLHGGMGADITYPIHRYFLWGKQIELLLGNSSRQLVALGASIAAQALAKVES
jgi:acyl-CoA dehydrogenase